MTQDLAKLVIPTLLPWKKTRDCVPRYMFGKGAKHGFSWYFEGTSKVKVKNLREICKWLMQCKYISDNELFMEDDFWQHPVTFEHLRKGDCEDHALWAWRKLSELGIEAEFVSGKRLDGVNHSSAEPGHAWVNFRKKDKQSWYVLESTAKNLDKMIITFEEAAKTYFPEVSIDGKLNTYSFKTASANGDNGKQKTRNSF